VGPWRRRRPVVGLLGATLTVRLKVAAPVPLPRWPDVGLPRLLLWRMANPTATAADLAKAARHVPNAATAALDVVDTAIRTLDGAATIDDVKERGYDINVAIAWLSLRQEEDE